MVMWKRKLYRLVMGSLFPVIYYFSPDLVPVMVVLCLFTGPMLFFEFERHLHPGIWKWVLEHFPGMFKEKPGEAVSHFYYGRASAISGENLDRGERELKQWLTTAAANAPPASQSAGHWRLGMIYEKQAKKDSARAEYQVAVSLNPKSDAKKMLDALKP